MKLSRSAINYIHNTKGTLEVKKNQAKEERGISFPDFIQDQLRQVRMNYIIDNNNQTVDYYDNQKRAQEYAQNEALGKKNYNSKEEIQNDINENRNNMAFNLATRNGEYVAIYNMAKEKVASQGSWDWLIHPFRTRAENKALKAAEKALEDNNISKVEIDTYNKLMNTNDLPEEVDIGEEKATFLVNPEKTTRNQIDLSNEINEKESEKTEDFVKDEPSLDKAFELDENEAISINDD